MPCLYCYRWMEKERREHTWRTKAKDRTGQCTLNPVWVETSGDHFCSHLAMNQSSFDGSSLMLSFQERMHDNYEDYEREKTERIRLEKVAKDLRAKLKAART